MIKLFTHIADLDGVSCAALVNTWFRDEKVEVGFCNYDDVDKKVREFIDNCCVDEYEKIFITDISIKDELAQEIDNRYKNFVLLDHHQSALDLNKYDWCTVAINNEEDLQTCGTELLYKYLTKEYFPLRNYRNYVELVRDYDTWRWKELGSEGLVSKQLNDLFHLYGRDRFLDWVRENYYELPSIPKKELEMLSLEQERNRKYIKSKEFQMVTKGSVGYVFAEKCASELGNYLCENHLEIDYVCIINISSKVISFRTIKDNVDVSKIAQMYGGGGHQKAAGCTFDGAVQIEAINRIFGC